MNLDAYSHRFCLLYDSMKNLFWLEHSKDFVRRRLLRDAPLQNRSHADCRVPSAMGPDGAASVLSTTSRIAG
jgi:hypothetical protein